MLIIENRHFFSSWSGGKDSCLAYYRAIQKGGIPKFLLTILEEDGIRSRSHGLPSSLIQRQAQYLKTPLITINSSWNNYEKNFIETIRCFKTEGINVGVFGDIDLEPHLEWVERVCSSVGITAYEPLWKQNRQDLLKEFIDLGFKALIVAVKKDVLDDDFLGQTLDRNVIHEMIKSGIDASGEKGEYHTMVFDGPIFSSAINLYQKEMIEKDGYCFLNVSINQKNR